MKTLLLALLLCGCATVNREWSTAVCKEKGPTSQECALSRLAEASDNREQAEARGSNATTGALIGCVATGPFCILGVGPLIGALIGGSREVVSYKEGKVPEDLKVQPVVQPVAAPQP